MADAIHTMRMVSKRTGLSPHVIRVWERRYGAVKPTRTPTNRRVYDDADVERLNLLHRATVAGHTISQAAKLSNEKLKALINQPVSSISSMPASSGMRIKELSGVYVERCLEAIKALDHQRLLAELESASLKIGVQGLMTKVAAPLAQRIGDLWRAGEVNAAQEHFLSAVLKSFLGRHALQYVTADRAPVIVVATPTGQIHELGAILVSAAAGNLGWRVVYLGTSLPANEIAGAVREQRARALALSIVYPEDDPSLPHQLRELKHYLPSDVELIVGGRGAAAYSTTLTQIGARLIDNLEEVFSALESMRKSPATA